MIFYDFLVLWQIAADQEYCEYFVKVFLMVLLSFLQFAMIL